jgi:hypothetical protein
MVDPEQRPLRPACRWRRGRRPVSVTVSRTAPAVSLLITAVLARKAVTGAGLSHFCIRLSIGAAVVRRSAARMSAVHLTIAVAADSARTAR